MDIKYLYFCDQPHKHWYEHIYNTYYPNSPHNSKHLFDIYTLTHIFWSLLLVLLLKKTFGFSIYVPIFVFIITTVFEIHENLKEQIIRYQRIEINSTGISSYRGDSLLNLIGDIFGNILGIILALTLNNEYNVIILLILFMVITNIVGISYWTDFLTFIIDF